MPEWLWKLIPTIMATGVLLWLGWRLLSALFPPRLPGHGNDPSSRFIVTMTGLHDADEPSDGSAEDHRLVTVARYRDPESAHLARLRLEPHDIPVFIADHNIVGTDWLYSNAIGSVKVQVPASMAEQAVRILESPPERSVSDDAPAPEPDPDAPHCPACGSDQLYRVRGWRRLFFGSILILGFPLPFSSTLFECDACGHRCRLDLGSPAGRAPVRD